MWKSPLYLDLRRIIIDSLRGRLLFVRPDRCINQFAFGYGSGGWHYYTALLEDFRDRGAECFSGSVLDAFYHKYHLRTVASYFGRAARYLVREERNLVLPWVADGLEPGLDDHVHQFGPHSPEIIRKDAECLISLEERIRKVGYRPFMHPDGLIRGYFLIAKSGDFRFVVTGGQHRCAVLNHLGYRRALMKLQPGFISHVRECQIETWPQVKTQRWPAEAAAEYFRLMFVLNGTERAVAPVS